jgi:hypothetical protein
MTPETAGYLIQEELAKSGLLAEPDVSDGIPIIRIQRVEGAQVGSIQLHPQILEGDDEKVTAILRSEVITALRAIVKEPLYRR